jgi:hypothetical protein
LDTTLRASILAVAVCGAALTLGALVVLGPLAARSVGIGAAIAAANLWALARIVAALLQGEDRTSFGALPMGIAIGALVSDRSRPTED